MRILAIDPSINMTGLAYFEDSQYRGSETFNIPKDRLKIRLGVLGEGIRRRVQLFDPNVTLIELAGKWTRLGKNVESLQFLAMATGVIFQAVNEYSQSLVYFIPVKDWKGKRKSQIIKREMELYYKTNFPSEHCSDAAAMAKWWIEQQKLKGIEI